MEPPYGVGIEAQTLALSQLLAIERAISFSCQTRDPLVSLTAIRLYLHASITYFLINAITLLNNLAASSIIQLGFVGGSR